MHLELARLLVVDERLGQRRLAEPAGEIDRVLHRQPRARADRVVGRVRSVAHQHDVALVPALAVDAREAHPDRRSAQVARVRAESRTAEEVREQLLAAGDRLVGLHLGEAEALPGLGPALDDHGRGLGLELVGVEPDLTVLGVLEDERERIELAVRAEPHEAVRPQVDVGQEVLGALLANARIGAVGGDDEVVAGEGREVVDVGREALLDTEAGSALLQDVEQPLAPDAAEAVPPGADGATVPDHVDVVPVGEVRVDRICRDRVVGAQGLEDEVAQHDSPAERVVGAIALVNDDLVTRVAQLHGDREVEACGPPADTGDPHVRRSGVSTR